MVTFMVTITAYAMVTFPRPIVNSIYMLGNQITHKPKKKNSSEVHIKLRDTHK